MPTVNITGTSSDGRGIARIDGMTVFVENAVEGDETEIQITNQKKRFAEARITKILKASPHRITPECPYFSECGGCHTANTEYAFEVKAKADNVVQSMRRIGGFKDFKLNSIKSGVEGRYRNKAVYKLNSLPQCGFYSAKSHNIIDVNDCRLCNEADAKILSAVREYIKETNALLTELFIRRGDTAMVCISADKKPQNIDLLVKSITEADKSVSSIILDTGKKEQVLFGSDYIESKLLGVRFRISKQSFFQVNPKMTEVLYKKALEYADLQGDERVLDIYCGIGTISLCAALHAGQVIGVEIVPQAIENAKSNARINNITNAQFYASSAEKIVPKLISDGERPDVVILDPPRKGSDEATLSAILKAKPKRIVYVSCNPATLARDAKLLASGGYAISASAAVDMFPRTAHVETVVLLQRQNT